MVKIYLLMLLVSSGGALGAPATAVEDNTFFSGTLVVEPCVIQEGDDNIQLEFGSVINKYLYEYQRSPGQPFTLHLTECDTAVAKSVSITFNGKESPELPGLLALDPGSGAAGVALGLESTDGRPLPLNKTSSATEMVKGDNQFTWQAYVQGEKNALANRTITPGEFTATATFSLTYD